MDLDFDRCHIWHPYTSALDPLPVYPVASARGTRIILEDGRELIDGMSSWWCAVWGYNNPRLNEAARRQMERMSHVMFGGLTHEPAIELAKRLVDICPGQDWVFYSDSGSVAVEVALKMAIQYQAALNRPKRCQIATMLGGYHGDTWHAMSVCDPQTGMHSLFAAQLPAQHFAPRPECGFRDEWYSADYDPMRRIIERNSDTLAAVIVEPIVQGAGGMRFYNSEYLRLLHRDCAERGILLILDEIATGFGRTGELFACEHAGVEADIMCVGKALTAGYMSFAATLCSSAVAEAVSRGEARCFMHGPTFMGNPLACAVACESVDMMLGCDLKGIVRRIEIVLAEELAEACGWHFVADVRVLGAIGVIETRMPVDMARLQKAFVAHGVWVRPFGRLVYLMPQYVISEADLRALCRGMKAALLEVMG